MGPTAAGKTALALALHAQLPVELVSVDAAQVYRGMDIGTAKPSPEERARVPHRLIDICDPAEAYSAARFRADALREISAIVGAGRMPLLVGGTSFYFRALESGLSELPSADPEVRAQLAAEAARHGWPALHARLCDQDPASAARIDPHDAQRIQRALEIIALTGRTRTELGGAARRPPYRFVKLALWPADRAALHRRIAERFRLMLNQGLVAEVETLYRRGDLGPSLPSVRTVGYRQVWAYLSGALNYPDMVEKSIIATRQLAKRQLTWLRAERDVIRLDCQGADLEGAARRAIVERVAL
ncbi:MAG TPA: tRNA (adenosine(37)-N6)-dimethylallyltransferase MiaA [Acidiferrobacterales bacterium]